MNIRGRGWQHVKNRLVEWKHFHFDEGIEHSNFLPVFEWNPAGYLISDV